MNSRLASPPFLVLFSLAVGVLNFLDTFIKLMYDVVAHQPYPLGVYLKPVFFFAQAASLLLFIRAVRSAQKPVLRGPALSRFFVIDIILVSAVILLYVDFQVLGLAGFSGANAFLQLAFYLVYLVALSGTSFWFAWRLRSQGSWGWFFPVLVFVGLAFIAAFLEPMLFWSQNYIGFAFPSQIALVVTYAPHVFMFLAAMSCFAIVFLRTSFRQSRGFQLALVLLVAAFILPLLWDGYKDGLINFVIRDVFYLGFGYSGYQWYSVSFYLMSIVAYVMVWRAISKSSDGSLAYSLIALGVASLPWNGVVSLKIGYSSVPGNAISLSSVITGVSLLYSQRGE